MEAFDDELPSRKFDNFQFVEYNKMLKRNPRNPDIGFAMMALMEVPGRFFRLFFMRGVLLIDIMLEQYRIIKQANLL